MTIVAVLTNSYDDSHVEAVFDIIRAKGHRTLRVNVDSIVKGEASISLDYATGEIRYSASNGVFDLCGADSIWYRKPFGFGQTLGFLEYIKDPVQRMVVEKEMHDIVDGVSMLLADKFWINHPAAIARARLKPYQISVAQRIGLPVPPTVITSDPDVARHFCGLGPTVFKPVSVSNIEYGENCYTVDTTLMTDELVSSLDLIRSQPVILQRFIEKSSELRVTCVGDALFVARQVPKSSSENAADWRSLQEHDSHYDIDYQLPWEIVDGVHNLMRELDLGFAAMDFAVDSRGDIHFLEVNPNGQWLGYTDMIGLPAAARIANNLIRRERF